MTSVRHTTMTTSTASSSSHPPLLVDGGSPLDGSLDALLEDLQNSVSRPGSAMGIASNFNGPTSENSSRLIQREVRVQRSTTGAPSVQYLQPANSTTVVTERAASPAFANESQQRITSYKTYQYQYQTDAGHPTGSSGMLESTSQRSRSVSPSPQKVTTYTERSTVSPESHRIRQNLNDLDTLLVDLHHAQHSTPQHVDTNPQTAQQITRTVRTYQFDNAYGNNTYGNNTYSNNTYGTPNSVRRELYPPSPKMERSSRAKSPPSPILNHQPVVIRSPSPVRAPSPTRKVTTTVKTYRYEIPGDEYTARPVGTPTVKTYSYEIPASPPTHDTVTTYKYASIPSNQTLIEASDNQVHTKTYNYGGKPLDREPLMEPSRHQPPPNNNTYITYNYSSSNNTTHMPPNHHNLPPHQPQPNHREVTHRPFPTPVPVQPASAEPPKRLDELMASFTDVELLDNNHVKYQQAERPVPAAPLDDYPDTPPAPPKAPAPVQERVRTKNIAGAPVYYPPGVELFSRKDEPVHAKMKEGASSSAAESSGKGGGAGVAAVPVCLPLCCAMPCVIM